MNFIYLLAFDFCQENSVRDILYLVGIVMTVIKIVVPIILIIVGSTTLIQAIGKQDDKEIKTATSSLAKKAVAAVVIFLFPSIVGLLMGLIGGEQFSKDNNEGCYTPLFRISEYTPTWETK